MNISQRYACRKLEWASGKNRELNTHTQLYILPETPKKTAKGLKGRESGGGSGNATGQRDERGEGSGIWMVDGCVVTDLADPWNLNKAISEKNLEAQ